MKTMHHGEQLFWENHRPNIHDWRLCLRPGDEVRLCREKRVSGMLYPFVKMHKGSHMSPALAYLGKDCWAIVINGKGKEMFVLRNSMSPINRINPPKEKANERTRTDGPTEHLSAGDADRRR